MLSSIRPIRQHVCDQAKAVITMEAVITIVMATNKNRHWNQLLRATWGPLAGRSRKTCNEEVTFS
jgi:hypothetical protein